MTRYVLVHAYTHTHAYILVLVHTLSYQCLRVPVNIEVKRSRVVLPNLICKLVEDILFSSFHTPLLGVLFSKTQGCYQTPTTIDTGRRLAPVKTVMRTTMNGLTGRPSRGQPSLDPWLGQCSCTFPRCRRSAPPNCCPWRVGGCTQP